MATYKVLVGINYPPNKRAEVGAVVSDIPSSSIKWLLDQEIIEVVEASSGKKKSSQTTEEIEEEA